MTGVDRYTDATATLRGYHDKAKSDYMDPRALAEAQVHATLAVAAATALHAILPLVGGDHEEVSAWAKLLLPGYEAGRRYTFREWFDVLAEDAPDLPVRVGHVEVNTDETGDGKPVLDVGAGRMGARLTPVESERLGLALLKWAESPHKPATDTAMSVLPDEMPEHWPPIHGDVWEDKDGDPWLAESNGTLVRLCKPPADDSPAEILRAYGPLRLRSRDRGNERCPF